MATNQNSSNASNTAEHKKVVKCIFCKSMNHVSWGTRKTLKRGIIQTYKCKDCNKRFTNNNGFYRMKNNDDIITMSIDMYLSNLSSRKMRNQLKRHSTTKISHVTVLDWVRKYVMKVYSYTEQFTPLLSGKYYMDETEIDCMGRNDFLMVAVDWETRFIPNHFYSLFNDVPNCTKFLTLIKEKNVPRYIQTDSATFYERSFRNVFEGKMDHRMNNVKKSGKHNVRIETVFMKLKDRIDDFRGLKATWSAPILLTGLILQHNFVEEHTTTRNYPCENAGININLGEDRWKELIELSVFI
jgi:transposase-like protein